MKRSEGLVQVRANGARTVRTGLVAAGMIALVLGGCRPNLGGLAGAAGDHDPAPGAAGHAPASGTGGSTPVSTPPNPGTTPTTGAGGSPASPAGSGGTPGNTTGTGGTEATMPPAPAADGGTGLEPIPPDQTSDAAPPPPPTSPASPDTCAPKSNNLAVSVRARRSGVDDFTFDGNGRLIALEQRDVIAIESDGKQWTYVAQEVTGSVGNGSLDMLPGGAFLVGDFQRDHLLRIDPSSSTSRPGQGQGQGQGPFGGRPTEANPQEITMSVRSPLKVVVDRGSNAAYVTSQANLIYRVDPQTGAVKTAVETAFKPGGIAIDDAKKKLYLGAIGRTSVVSYDIGADGTLTNMTTLVGSIPQPEALLLDSCGGLYIGGADGGAIRRVAPGSMTATVVARVTSKGVTSMAFGTGKDGWSADSIFALDSSAGDFYEIKLK